MDGACSIQSGPLRAASIKGWFVHHANVKGTEGVVPVPGHSVYPHLQPPVGGRHRSPTKALARPGSARGVPLRGVGPGLVRPRFDGYAAGVGPARIG